MNEPMQRELPFQPSKEQARLARVERLLGSELRQKLKRASDLSFNYQSATEIARRAKSTPIT